MCVLFAFSSGAANKILMSNVPPHITLDDVQQLLSNYGQIQNIEKVASRDPVSQSIHAVFETVEQAHQ